jgi:hypothetical protein
MNHATDSCTPAGARLLANRIAEYWHARGLAGVRVWVEAVPVTNPNVTQFTGGVSYAIRSNIAQLTRQRRAS